MIDSSNANGFDEVTRNGFDFLSRAISELETHPKYSVIHFYSAVELFLKARLLKEHWTLVVMKPDKADREEFKNGGFSSVGLSEANERLCRVAKDGLQVEELKCFDGLRKERNRMIHFFHPIQGEDHDAKKAIGKIVEEQCRGWFYLHRLLTDRWSEHFEAYADEIQRMDALMRQRASYLREKFQAIEPQIGAAKAAGHHFVACPSCHYDALEVDAPTSLERGRCLVCLVDGLALAFECIKCKQTIALINTGNDTCGYCDQRYEPKHVRQILENADLLRDLNPMDTDEPSVSSCGECGSHETVVPLEIGWFCTDCFSFSSEEDLSQCEWCGERSTDIPEASYFFGCSQCEGKARHMRDKDD